MPDFELTVVVKHRRLNVCDLTGEATDPNAAGLVNYGFGSTYYSRVNGSAWVMRPGGWLRFDVFSGSAPATFLCHMDGGGGPLTTAIKTFSPIFTNFTISEAILLAEPAGDLVVDIRKAAYDDWPVVASICGANKPTIAAGQKDRDTTLTGWDVDIVANDILDIVVDSVAGVNKATLALKLLRA